MKEHNNVPHCRTLDQFSVSDGSVNLKVSGMKWPWINMQVNQNIYIYTREKHPPKKDNNFTTSAECWYLEDMTWVWLKPLWKLFRPGSLLCQDMIEMAKDLHRLKVGLGVANSKTKVLYSMIDRLRKYPILAHHSSISQDPCRDLEAIFGTTFGTLKITGWLNLVFSLELG